MTKGLEAEQGALYKFKLASFIAILSALVVSGVWIVGGDFCINLERLADGHFYVKAFSWDLPLFVALPVFAILIWGLFLRLIGRASDRVIQKGMQIAVRFAITAIATWLIYGFSVSYVLASRGYARCSAYTSPAMASPSVWIRDSGYCVGNSGHIRREILAWFDSLPPSTALTPSEVEAQVALMMAEWDRQNR